MEEAVIRMPMVSLIENGKTVKRPKYRDPDRVEAYRIIDWGTSSDESECTAYVRGTTAQLNSLAGEADVTVL